MENKKTRTIWSSNATEEYYSKMSKSELIQECKNLDYTEINDTPVEKADRWDIIAFLSDKSDYDQDYEDFIENVVPMLIEQCYDKKVYLSGTYSTWSGGHGAVCAADEEKLKHIVYPDYDNTSWIEQDSKGIYFTEAHHDVPIKGATKMYMYGFLTEEDYRKAEKKLRRICSEEDREEFCMENIEWYFTENEYIDILIDSNLLKPLENKL